MPILEANNVRKSYGRAVALDGVNLSVEPGELFGLLGPNGAGKTTLMSLLSGLADPTSGTVCLFGERLGMANRELRRRVGLATQDLAIYPELTARENLVFFGRLYGMTRADLRSRVGELLAAVGLSDRADHRTGTFSGGMKRRLNLAVAVVHRPDLLLLDEPTTGVDPQSRNHIYEHVRSLNRAGMTVIYTSHYMEEVQTLCPRIAILDQGKVLACDALPSLLGRLGATIRLRLTAVADELPSRIAALPGVTSAEPSADGVTVTTPAPGPLLPKLAALCAEVGAEPTAIDLDQPSLERVFLSLTGHDLRD